MPAGDLGQHLGAARGDEIADDGRETGRAVVLARDADGDSDREQYAEVREYCLAGSRDCRQVQQVRLAEPQQQAGDRQYRDRQHQRPSELLQAREPSSS